MHMMELGILIVADSGGHVLCVCCLVHGHMACGHLAWECWRWPRLIMTFSSPMKGASRARDSTNATPYDAITNDRKKNTCNTQAFEILESILRHNVNE